MTECSVLYHPFHIAPLSSSYWDGEVASLSSYLRNNPNILDVTREERSARYITALHEDLTADLYGSIYGQHGREG